MEIYYNETQAPFEGDPGEQWGDYHYPSRGPARRPRRTLVYVLAMVAATLTGSAFVIGGLVAGAQGLSAVLLAAAVPLAALLWAITLSLLQREHAQVRRFDGPRVDRDEDR